ncbi:jade family PHD finger 2 [Homo sapiens]|uniref:E3 ubiquitin-protein ligase Jade-2 n=2 Tax=Homo sapiens TaxID=9606 RepID=JADE2_HUMAN|nr:E3 ubiquitin-protein ligase Jade-2 isoform 3 [Homo sapiens]XP_047272994.1 E3 ubiquitin-protein ligase Jade-2 isoform X13 [Homo sapiens]XP_047272995.1 E3 ubiquitin-protein ligase Jade-2 isoform X13 [Homo sapiens]XP_054208209.1 E3 ubiquitin-protein ligase Jade-2 isoform X13 [Homo sapiens]XP_054208210.1 E3 ubiquitin-protein ligase Jade-2 isoform X13 [Homo sapiens]Q9NQC1.2 RecName: Full=E3 ubiquitin-protein ligase Jade-2; AltName: Full=Jade family PHD finger protein 2; AltName: Full=PHD finger |eukprot:NP_056103.4 E3 ubiquitin-protein ligase Jade-2 isoform 3 [Homo sapiens]
MEEKRRKYSISSDNSDTTDSHATSTSASRCSKLPSSTKSGWPRQNEKKPSEVFRTDLITAMKIPDSYQLSPDDYYILADPWRQEWEKGVQVPAGAEAIPEPVVRILPPLEGPPAQASPSSTMLGEGSQPDWPGGSRYDLDEIDAYWLELINSELKEMERPELDELTLERVLEELETLCHQNMARAIETQEGLGIEYDEDVVCDVCRSPEGEDGNEMVFCDKCNVCVHQACYGILKVPTGSWLCRTCALGVQPKCLLCPKRGGALKPTRSGTKWVHVSCALWIPEVSIGCPEKMEPITKISHIPASRWALSCSLCKECTGTCIQCSMPSCVTAFHVTCAFDHGLEMRTILADNDEVKFKSFCQEHSDGGPRNEPTSEPTEPSQAGEDLEKVTLRKQRLQQLEEDFYELVEPAEVAERLDLAEALVDFIYQYWKLKRKANANQPLLTPKTDEVDNLAQQEQDVLYRRLKLFTHLRQDLERVRNLCYMVTRRERTKHAICKLQEQIFHLQMKLIEQDLCRGLSTSFPIDGTFFNSWLAQSVQITAENMAMSEWPLNNGHREDPAPGLLSEELLQDEETLLSFMRDPSLRPGDPARKARGRTRLPAKKKPPPPPPQDGPGSRTTPDKAPKKTWGQDAGSGKGGQGPPTRKPPRRTSSHLPSSPAAGDCPILATPESPPPLAPETPDEAASVAADSDVQVPGPAASPKPLGRLRPPRESKVTRRLPGARPDAGMGPPSAVAERPKVSLHFDTETDGYFSDGEMSDSDVEAEDGGVQRGPREAGAEEVVRMGVLAS